MELEKAALRTGGGRGAAAGEDCRWQSERQRPAPGLLSCLSKVLTHSSSLCVVLVGVCESECAPVCVCESVFVYVSVCVSVLVCVGVLAGW